MTERHRVFIEWLVLLLSLVGVAIALYLTTVHYEHLPLFCSTGGLVNCERVTSSPYSVIGRTTIPITVPGLGWAILSAGLAVVALRTRTTSPSSIYRVALAQWVWSLLALLVVLYLVYVEIVLLHTICAWCTALHVVILLTFLLTLVLLLTHESEPTEQTEGDETDSLTPTSRFR